MSYFLIKDINSNKNEMHEILKLNIWSATWWLFDSWLSFYLIIPLITTQRKWRFLTMSSTWFCKWSLVKYSGLGCNWWGYFWIVHSQFDFFGDINYWTCIWFTINSFWLKLKKNGHYYFNYYNNLVESNIKLYFMLNSVTEFDINL